MTEIAECIHNWHFIRITRETAEKRDGIMKGVTVSKFICSNCGMTKLLEYVE